MVTVQIAENVHNTELKINYYGKLRLMNQRIILPLQMTKNNIDIRHAY